MVHEVHVSMTWNIALTQNQTNDTSIKSSLDAVHNHVSFSFVRPTTAVEKLQNTIKLNALRDVFHSMKVI